MLQVYLYMIIYDSYDNVFRKFYFHETQPINKVAPKVGLQSEQDLDSQITAECRRHGLL